MDVRSELRGRQIGSHRRDTVASNRLFLSRLFRFVTISPRPASETPAAHLRRHGTNPLPANRQAFPAAPNENKHAPRFAYPPSRHTVEISACPHPKTDVSRARTPKCTARFDIAFS